MQCQHVLSFILKKATPLQIPWRIDFVSGCCITLQAFLCVRQVPVRGYFAHALVDPSSCFRVALKSRPLRSLVGDENRKGA